MPHRPASPVVLEPDYIEGFRQIYEEKIVFNQTIGLKLTRITPEGVAARIEMRPELVGHFAYNRIHGGVISAALDAIALQTVDLVDAMNRDGAGPLAELRADGGAARNNLLLQTQADLLGVPVIRPRQIETTALGAAYFAGLAVGVWQSPAELAAHWRAERIFEPARSDDWRHPRLAEWHRAVERSRDWATG